MFLRAWASELVRAGREFVYPPACHWCSGLISEAAGESARFCDRCELQVAPLPEHRCVRCSAPVGPYVETAEGCVHCRRWTWSFDQVVSLGAYDDQLRLACLRCKSRGQSALATALTELLEEREGDTLRAWEADLVIPVPHHWTDRIRQEHAASTIAERLGRCLRVPTRRTWLRKRRRTERQMNLSAEARTRNLRDAFRVPANVRLQGRTVLLADDILTTGMTAQYCTRALLQAGAKRVVVAVLARGLANL